MAEVQFWVRPEVMELGVLPILPPDKISIEMLSRLLQYSQDLGERGYPQMNYETWKHVAVKKMGLSVECSMVVFFSCLLFSKLRPGRDRELEATLAAAASQKERDEVMGGVEVWTMELIILLYLHRVTSAHPRAIARQASLQTLTTDPWPNSNISGATARKQLLEEKHAGFVREALPELLSLLAGHLQVEDTEKKKKSGDKRTPRELLGFMKSAGVLSVDVVKSLGFIIGTSLQGDKAEHDLLSVAMDTNNCYRSGYLSKKNAFQKGLFEQWLLRGLDWAPHGEWLCVRRGCRQSWPVVSLAPQTHHRFVTSPSSGHRLMYICELIDGLTAHMGDEAAPCDLKVRRCSKSNIYILQPIRNAVIHKCHDTRIVLGPVSGRIRLSECRNTVVVCAARSVVIADCRGVIVHTLTPQRPLLVGGRTQGVSLAPLNIHYPRLKHHMAKAQLQSHINRWNRPLHLGSEGVLGGACEVMNPEDFQLLVIPFTQTPPIDGRPPLLPPGLPHEFAKSVEEAGKCVSSFRAEVRDAELSPEQRAILQKAVDAKFKAWLRDTGKQRELDQLEKLALTLKYERVAKTTAI
ncbi:TBCC domain-containing protein 1-like isoform X1 [Homarus americanus]|uniref:TBCC domain-containing protein 1-like isoform X1 n=2 Tax=Homarus americanus TaxID=6706 RepID=UPI001C456090|nr:TBCC domain-containing protein 1-like isoform X1 [Homarus americanus]XP_042219741.1 TBCC domain-containing protein 1-like isoform X1 [Homarus americanus]